MRMFYSAGLLAVLAANTGCAFSKKGAQKMYNQWGNNKSYDMIIVPGIPLGDSLVWDRIMKGRVYWAKFLYDKGIAKNIMFSGSAVHTPFYEGKVMGLYAEALGIPKEKIFTELKAEHSTENIFYGYKKSIQLGFKSVALASDPFQCKLLRSFAHSKLSPDIGILPFVADTLRVVETTMINPVIDHQLAFKQDFIPLRKRENWWKRMKGTLGKNRDKKAYE